jgi:hypothetical protein
VINNSYLQASYSGISIYPEGVIYLKVDIKGLLKPIKYVAQNKKNEIWAADNYRACIEFN